MLTVTRLALRPVVSRSSAALLARGGAAAATSQRVTQPLAAIVVARTQQQRNVSSFSRQHHAHMPISSFRRFMPIQFVPEREAWIIERFGKFSRVVPPGLMFMIPLIDRVQYVHSLKVVPMEIPNQIAITQDNVTIDMDGVLYFQVLDPIKASYNIDDIDFAISQMALSTMRAEIGKLSLERLFQERSKLNERIMAAINAVSADWGVSCLRYEIRDISPPKRVLEAMELQVVAERRKRETIIYSEGQRQADINVAEGKKIAAVLESEAVRMSIVNTNKGEAEAIRARAEATAAGIKVLATAIESSESGESAVKLRVAEQYINAFSKLAQSSTTMLLPSNAGDPNSFVAQAMAVYERVAGRTNPNAKKPAGSNAGHDVEDPVLPIPLDTIEDTSTLSSPDDTLNTNRALEQLLSNPGSSHNTSPFGTTQPTSSNTSYTVTNYSTAHSESGDRAPKQY